MRTSRTFAILLIVLFLVGCGTHTSKTGAKAVSETVYTTKTGQCYHRAGCSSLRYSSYETTRKKAEAKGYRPCRRCIGE